MTAYQYDGTVLAVHDGDTCKVSLRLCRMRLKDQDLGLHLYVEDGWLVLHADIRLLGLNAPELPTPEGKASQQALVTMMPVGTPVVVFTQKDHTEKYGRWLGDIWLKPAQGYSMNKMMIDGGFALPWDGTGARPT